MAEIADTLQGLEKYPAEIHENEPSPDFVIAGVPGSRTVSERRETSAEQNLELGIRVYFQCCVRSYYRADQDCRGNDCHLDSEVAVQKVAVEVLAIRFLLGVGWYQGLAVLGVVAAGRVEFPTWNSSELLRTLEARVPDLSCISGRS